MSLSQCFRTLIDPHPNNACYDKVTSKCIHKCAEVTTTCTKCNDGLTYMMNLVRHHSKHTNSEKTNLCNNDIGVLAISLALQLTY